MTRKPSFIQLLPTLLVIAMLLPAVARAVEPPSAEERMLVLYMRLLNYIADFEAQMSQPDPHPWTREIAVYAHNLLAIGGNPQDAEDMLDYLFEQQIMTPGDPHMGNFPWIVGDGYSDENTVSFTMVEVGPILIRYTDRLSPGYIAGKEDNLYAAAQSMIARDVAVTYTNVYLMDMASLLMLGQILDDGRVFDEGHTRLDEWITYTEAKGISEYVSPTYTAVQLSALVFAHNHIDDLTVKGKLRMVLDFLWRDVAANSFYGKGSYGPSWSRAANFIGESSGGIDHLLYMEGLRDEQSFEILFPTGSRYFVNYLEGGYRPTPDILDLATIHPRTVQQLWESGDYGNENRERYNYVTQDFAISNANGYYSPYDKQIALHLASDDALPAVSVVSDFFDNPYGKNHPTSSGKPVHLRNDASYVQKDGTILALMDVTAYDSTERFDNIATSILFPLNVDAIYLNEQPLSGSFNETADNSTWLFLKEDNTAVGLRIFHASGLYGYAPQYQVKSDGATWGCGRLVAYQYVGQSQSFDHTMDARAGVIMIAQEVADEAAFAAFRSNLQQAPLSHSLGPDKVWTAVARLQGSFFEAGLDLDTGLPTTRAVDEIPYVGQAFCVNGTAYPMTQVTLSSQTGFAIEQDETVLYQHDFNSGDGVWQLDNDLTTAGGALENTALNTQMARLDLAGILTEPLDLRRGPVNVYLRCTYDGTVDGQDLIGCFLGSVAQTATGPYAGALVQNMGSWNRLGAFADETTASLVDPTPFPGQQANFKLSVNTGAAEDYKLRLSSLDNGKLAVTLCRDSARSGEWFEVHSVVVPDNDTYPYYGTQLLGSTELDQLILRLSSIGETINAIALTRGVCPHLLAGDISNDGRVDLTDWAWLGFEPDPVTRWNLLLDISDSWLQDCFTY